jgi:hypothetical protein
MLIRVLIIMPMALFLFQHPCDARYIASRLIAYDLKIADYVALVSVVAFEDVYNDAHEHCNVKYTTVVIDAIKGVTNGDTLEWHCFDRVGHYEIGSLYIVFLAKPGRFYDNDDCTNCISESLHEDAHNKCWSTVTVNRVVHWEYALLTVGYFFKGWNQTVKVPKVIELPKGLEAHRDYQDADKQFWFYSLVRLEDLISYLKSLQR